MHKQNKTRDKLSRRRTKHRLNCKNRETSEPLTKEGGCKDSTVKVVDGVRLLVKEAWMSRRVIRDSAGHAQTPTLGGCSETMVTSNIRVNRGNASCPPPDSFLIWSDLQLALSWVYDLQLRATGSQRDQWKRVTECFLPDLFPSFTLSAMIRYKKTIVQTKLSCLQNSHNLLLLLKTTFLVLLYQNLSTCVYQTPVGSLI